MAAEQAETSFATLIEELFPLLERKGSLRREDDCAEVVSLPGEDTVIHRERVDEDLAFSLRQMNGCVEYVLKDDEEAVTAHRNLPRTLRLIFKFDFLLAGSDAMKSDAPLQGGQDRGVVRFGVASGVVFKRLLAAGEVPEEDVHLVGGEQDSLQILDLDLSRLGNEVLVLAMIAWIGASSCWEIAS